MPVLTSYSVTLNAVPAIAGGTFNAGDVVTKSGSGYVLATTANRAGQSGAVYGIALEAGVAGGPAVQIVDSGYVPPELWPSGISGSGDYVDVNAGGAVVRSASAGVDTLGRYMPDGGVVVDVNLQLP